MTGGKMDAEQFEVLSKKLDAIIGLLAQDKLADKSKTDSILFLNQLGLDNSTIATILNSTPGSVAVRISEAKKAKGNKDSKKEKIVKEDNQQIEPEPEVGLPSEGMPS
jgi:hypothetical protein